MLKVLDVSPVPGVQLLYRLALMLAVVSGLFCAVFLTVLIINYHGYHGRLFKTEIAGTTSTAEPSYRVSARDSFNRLPTHYQSFLSLRQALAQNRQDETVRAQIRQLDHDLRINFFARRAAAQRATYFLIISSALFLIAVRTISVLKRNLPDPTENTQQNGQKTSWTFALFLSWFMLFGGLYLGLLLAPNPDIEQIFMDRLIADADAALPAEVSQPATRGSQTAEVPQTAASSQTAGIAPPADITPPLELTEELFARNWVSFRNFDGNGIGFADPATPPPTQWNGRTGENILWQSPVPLPGNSSPVIWLDDAGGGRLFLTGADEHLQQIFCYDISNGSLLWTADVSRPEAGIPSPIDDDTGYAAPTPAVDGRHVYAMFANGELAAVNFSGELVWRKSFGLPDNSYGFSSSPALHYDRLIVQFDNGDGSDGTSKIVALNLSDGSIIWEVPRDMPNSWASPTIKRIGDTYQIITCADPFAIAYNPEDGSEIWRVRCLPGADVGPSAISHGNVVLITNTAPRTTAIDATGTGDITSSHILWVGANALSDSVSPVATEQYFLTLDSYGFLTGYDPTVVDSSRNRARFWEFEVGNGASFYSSPLRVGPYLYAFDKSPANPRAFVLDMSKVEIDESGMLTDESEAALLIAENPMPEPCVTSPAILNNRIYIRGKDNIYCIGE